MRYFKVFFLVFLFFMVMMLFVQNQPQFSDAVTLKFDPMFAPVMTSMPMPRYALLLISFIIGAVVVLIMLIWDRISISARLTAARRRVSSLQKQLEKMTAEKEKIIAEKTKLEAALKEAEEKAS